MSSLSGLANAQFSNSVRLDTNTLPGASESDGIALTNVGDTIHAAWFEVGAVSGRDIYYTRSMDAGISWEAPRRIDQDPGVGDQEFPVLLAEGQTVAIAWLDDRATPLIQDVYVRVSQNGGTTFAAEIAATGILTGDANDADNLVGAIALPNIYLVFEDNTNAVDLLGTNEDAFVVRSANSGVSFAAPRVVNHPPAGPGSADIDSPSVTASGSTVHVAWVDRRNGVADKVFINTSVNSGLTFAATDTRLDSTVALDADANTTRIAISGNNLIVTWRDNQLNPLSTAKKLYMNASVDGGSSFLGQVRLDSATLTANAKSGKIAFSGDRFVVGWIDDRNDPLGILDDVFIRTGSFAGGVLSLDAEKRIEQTAPGTSDNGSVKLGYSADNLYVLYQDSRKDPMNLNDSLYLRVSHNNGASFQPEIPLSKGLSGLMDVEGDELVLVSQRKAVAVWGDNRNGVGLLPPNDVFSAHGKPFTVVGPGRRTSIPSTQRPRIPQ